MFSYMGGVDDEDDKVKSKGINWPAIIGMVISVILLFVILSLYNDNSDLNKEIKDCELAKQNLITANELVEKLKKDISDLSLNANTSESKRIATETELSLARQQLSNASSNAQILSQSNNAALSVLSSISTMLDNIGASGASNAEKIASANNIIKEYRDVLRTAADLLKLGTTSSTSIATIISKIKEKKGVPDSISNMDKTLSSVASIDKAEADQLKKLLSGYAITVKNALALAGLDADALNIDTASLDSVNTLINIKKGDASIPLNAVTKWETDIKTIANTLGISTKKTPPGTGDAAPLEILARVVAYRFPITAAPTPVVATEGIANALKTIVFSPDYSGFYKTDNNNYGDNDIMNSDEVAARFIKTVLSFLRDLPIDDRDRDQPLGVSMQKFTKKLADMRDTVSRLDDVMAELNKFKPYRDVQGRLRIPMSYLRNSILMGWSHGGENGVYIGDPNTDLWGGVAKGVNDNSRALVITAEDTLDDTRTHLTLKPNAGGGVYPNPAHSTYMYNPYPNFLQSRPEVDFRDDAVDLRGVLGTQGLVFDMREIVDGTKIKEDATGVSSTDCVKNCRNNANCHAAWFPRGSQAGTCVQYGAGAKISDRSGSSNLISVYVPPKDNIDINIIS